MEEIRHPDRPMSPLEMAFYYMEQSQLPVEHRPLRQDELESHLLLLRAVTGQMLVLLKQLTTPHLPELTRNLARHTSLLEDESSGSEPSSTVFFRVRAVTSTEQCILQRLLTSHGPNYCPTIGDILNAGLAEVSTHLRHPTSERQ